jgi:hypothetical protein
MQMRRRAFEEGGLIVERPTSSMRADWYSDPPLAHGLMSTFPRSSATERMRASTVQA